MKTTAIAPARTLHPAARLLVACLQALALAGTTLPSATLAARSNAPVTINFVNADIDAVARAMGVIIGKQFVVDPRVKGTITVYSETPVAPATAYLNFQAALRGVGAAVVESSGLLKIVPEADAKTISSTVAIGNGADRRGDQIMTQIFRLQHESANNLVPVLRPLISPNNTINANPGTNTLVITDYADNLKRIGKIITAMDLPASTGLEVVPVRNAVAADIAPLVERMADAQGSSGGLGQGRGGVPAIIGGGSTSTIVLADPRTNSLLVKAPTPAKLAIVKDVVAKLDVGGAGGAGGSNIHVVPLKHAEATRMAQILRASFDTDKTSGSGGSGQGNAAQSQQNNSANNSSSSSSSTSGLSSAATTPVNQTAAPQTGGYIQADPATNSLIITAPEPLYRQLRAVIDQLDSRRAQVYIEALIIEVNATKAADLGVQWESILGKKGDSTVVGAGTNYGSGLNNIVNLSAIAGSGNAISNMSSALSSSATQLASGFSLGVLTKVGSVYTVGALAQFLQTNADGNVLSAPTLLTLDNEEAKIVIGENVPFVTGSYATTSSSSTVSPFTTVERKDVGLTLRIRPQIGENGTIKLTIYEENSDVTSTSSTLGPTTKKSSVESQVIVDDGSMLAIGGLMKDTYSNNESKIPGLGDVPLVGGLFRSSSRSRAKTNLMLFIKPVIVADGNATTRYTLDRYDMIRARQEAGQPTDRWFVNKAPLLANPPAMPQDPESEPGGLPAVATTPASAASAARAPGAGYVLPKVKSDF